MNKKLSISIRRVFLWATVAMGALAAVSCQDDVAQHGQVSGNGRIMFATGNDGMASRAADGPKLIDNNRFLMSVGKDSLFIQAMEEENAVTIHTDTVAQGRGASITDNNLTSFYVAAYEDEGNVWVAGNTDENSIVKVTGEEGGETELWMFNPDKNWPEDYRNLHFHGYAASLEYIFEPQFPLEESGSLNTARGGFSYKLPAPGEEGKDAEKQPDLIVAITPNQNRKPIEPVKINFYHALSAVVFQVGNIPENTRLGSISLKNVHSGGDCTYTVSANGLDFKWDSNGATTYTQTFNQKIKTNEKLTDTNSKAAFMMIPQEFSDNAIVSVEVVVDEPEEGATKDYSRTYVANMKLKELINGVTEWKAHHKYTYIISLKEGVEVNVEDEVDPDGMRKDNVVITNAGPATSYIRATIVGNWVNDAGIVLATPWSLKDNGGNYDKNFSGLPGTNWLEGNDGFFYYSLPVKGGSEIKDPLFGSYALQPTDIPIIGAHLEFNIVVQAVQKQHIRFANWPVTVSDTGVLSVNN